MMLSTGGEGPQDKPALNLYSSSCTREMSVIWTPLQWLHNMFSAFQEKSTACSLSKDSPNLADRGKTRSNNWTAVSSSQHPEIPLKPSLNTFIQDMPESWKWHIRYAYGVPTMHIEISFPCIQPVFQLQKWYTWDREKCGLANMVFSITFQA